MKRKNRYWLINLLALLLAGIWLAAQNLPEQKIESLYRVNLEEGITTVSADVTRMLEAKVVKHVDGDTVKVRIMNPPPGIKEEETLRLLGVDTPETVHPSKPVERFGKEASEYTKAVLLGTTVYLAFDWDLRDRYGRLLVYIYRAPSACFNAELLYNGYAYAYTKYPFEFMEDFKLYEKSAMERKAGLWAD